MNTQHLRAATIAARDAEQRLADQFRETAARHAGEVDIRRMCTQLAKQCTRHAELIGGIAGRYGAPAGLAHPARTTFNGARLGVALLDDLRDLYMRVQECDIAWTVVGQGAKAARNAELIAAVYSCQMETGAQGHWVKGRLKEAAPQALAG
jgi:hypothetical protein